MKKHILMCSAAAFSLIAVDALTTIAAAQDDQIIITGTRRADRSASDSTAPIDVIGADDFQNQGTGDMTELLRTNVPSYNVNTQPISDAATLIRPANLRGLSPDNTLILVNGKRRHRAAVITFLGGGIADGSQGPDVSTIPGIALKQVEVLRDGASSQYGSDAIAGVINFILDDASEGGVIEAKAGSTYEGDGTFYQVSGKKGFAIGNGFLSVAGEYRQADPTSRSVQRDDAAALIAAGNTAVANPAQIWGQPEIIDDYKLWANFGTDDSMDHQFYGFANYAAREVEGGFFFRNPTNRGGVYRGPQVNPATGNAVVLNDNGTPADPTDDFFTDAITNAVVAAPVSSVLVGDLSLNDTGDCPAGIPLTAGGGLLPDPTILGQVTADANCFSFVELFPGGFTPRFGGNLEDWSVNFGIRGEWAMGNGLGYDISFYHGDNQIDYFIKNTVNASLGPNQPAGNAFNPGGYGQVEDAINVDFTYGMPIEGFASDLNIAFGYEWREEDFEVRAGDAASYALGPLAAAGGVYPLGQGFSSSSNGFGGFTPASAGKNSLAHQSFYVDTEADVTDALTLQAAVRYEDYDVFGEDTNYKVGALFRVTDTFRLRGTYSTGFHAPTAGQVNVINVTTQFTNGQLQDQGTFPLTSAAGQIVADYISSTTNGGLGLARPTLTPETADNFSVGAVFNLGPAEVTLDFFNIKLKDRIALSSQIDFTAALTWLAAENSVSIAGLTQTSQILNALANAGVVDRNDFTGFEDLTQFGFFNNDFDTETKGMDLVATMPLEFTQSGDTKATLVVNYTDTSVTNVGATVNPTRVRQLEDNLPAWRGNLQVVHTEGPWRMLGRLNYFGEFYEAHLDDGTLPINADAQVTFDVEAGYAFDNGFEVIGGVQNLFDSYPTDNPWAGIVGSKYPATAPNGFAGGTYYLRVRKSF